jgi:NADH-quinone oxidoreductase subunit N
MTPLFWQLKMLSLSVPLNLIFDKCSNLQNISWIDFVHNIPEIYLAFIIFIGLILVGTANFLPTTNLVIQKKEITLSLYEFARISLLITLGLYLFQIFSFLNTTAIVFNSYSIIDSYTQALKVVILLTAWLLLTASRQYVTKHPRHLMEYPILLLLTTLFLLILISSYNLMTLFLAIIGFSLNIYVLLLYDSFNHSSREAGIKYYYLSTFSSGLIISAIFFAYLIFHNTSFISISWILHNWSIFGTLHSKSVLLYVMMYFLVFGFLFKLAAFPCHLWAPEVYDGSPHPITAIFVLPIKIATFGLFLRLLNYTFADLYFIWSYIIWMSAFFSMIWGCLGALGEQIIKRFIAYSSINQMGFLFMGLACGTFEGIRAALIYLVLYILMNLGFFLLFLNTREEKTNRALTYLSDFNDYANNHYLYSVTLVIILFSMAGIPPLGGFFGKYFLFLHSFEVGHYLLVIVGMITSLIATYYYLRIIKIMWFEQPILNRFQFRTKFTDSLFAIYIGLEFILVWFIIWSPWIFKYLNFLTSTCINPLTSS